MTLLVRSVVIALILIGLDSARGIYQSSLAVTQRGCEPMGRVLGESDRRLRAGSLVCKGTRLNVAPGARVTFLCFLNGRILQLRSGPVEEQCLRRVQRVRRCSAGDRSYCPKPKGPGENSDTPELISPFGSALLNGRPVLSWYAVPSSTSYTVSIKGQGVSWEETVVGTTLPYPSEQPAMQFGNAYKITIIANQGDSPISASTAVVNRLPYSEAQLIAQAVESINRLKLSEDEVISLDIDSIYMSRSLLSETIEALNSRVKAGSRNPVIYRLLGDRYLEAGLPDYAKQQYEIAGHLAVLAADAIELAKAQAGLEQVAAIENTP